MPNWAKRRKQLEAAALKALSPLMNAVVLPEAQASTMPSSKAAKRKRASPRDGLTAASRKLPARRLAKAQPAKRPKGPPRPQQHRVSTTGGLGPRRETRHDMGVRLEQALQQQIGPSRSRAEPQTSQPTTPHASSAGGLAAGQREALLPMSPRPLPVPAAQGRDQSLTQPLPQPPQLSIDPRHPAASIYSQHLKPPPPP